MTGVGGSLAGGQGRRMGGVDKAMVRLAGQTLMARVFARLAPQVAVVAISANGDPARFATFGVAVLPDAPLVADAPVLPEMMPARQPVGPLAGPLAGLLAGARWALAAHRGALLLCVPCDVPFLPVDLVARLEAAGAPCCAASFGQLHPLAALWQPETLVSALAGPAGGGSARRLLAALGGGSVVWNGTEDPFMNVNDREALWAASCRARNGCDG